MMEVDVKAKIDDQIFDDVKEEVINEYDIKIDLEEHNIQQKILDHHQIENIIPDLNAFKTEPTEYEEDHTEIKEERIDQEINEKAEEIIVKREDSEMNVIKHKVSNLSNKYCEISVNIKDIGLELYNCRLYCKECKILFPTENKINSHKLDSHPNLVSVTNKPSCVVSTQVMDKNTYTTKEKSNSFHLPSASTFSEKDKSLQYIDPIENKLNNKLVYHRCSKCKYVVARYAKRHKCHPARRYKCHICGLILSLHLKVNHLQLHKHRDFDENDLTFIDFDPVDLKLNDQLIYDRCSKCKYIMVSNGCNNINQHKCASARRYKCHICGLVMSCDIKDHHLKLHEENGFFKNNVTYKYFNPVENKLSDKLIYHRCLKCKCVVTGKAFNNTSYHKCESTRRYICHICGIAMVLTAKGNHLMLHKNKDFTVKDITFKDFDPFENKVNKQLVFKRCSACKCIILKNNFNIRRHICVSTDRYKCSLCGLVMTSDAKENHNMLHKNRDFSEKDVTFIYFDPVIDKADDQLVYNRCPKCQCIIVMFASNHINLHKCNSSLQHKSYTRSSGKNA